MLCALIRNGIVIEVTDVPEEQLTTEFVNSWSQVIDVTNESPTPEAGWIVDGVRFFPAPGVVATPSKKISKLALRNRLTFNEKIAIETVLLNTAHPYCIPLRAWYQDFTVATFVDLARPDTISGIHFLEQIGLIGVGRADHIINDPIADIERYRG